MYDLPDIPELEPWPLARLLIWGHERWGAV